jgi:hypothetical protein
MVKGAHERVVAKSSGALFEREALCQTDDDSSKVCSRCSCVLFPQLCGIIQRSLHKRHNLLRRGRNRSAIGHSSLSLGARLAAARSPCLSLTTVSFCARAFCNSVSRKHKASGRNARALLRSIFTPELEPFEALGPPFHSRCTSVKSSECIQLSEYVQAGQPVEHVKEEAFRSTKYEDKTIMFGSYTDD